MSSADKYSSFKSCFKNTGQTMGHELLKGCEINSLSHSQPISPKVNHKNRTEWKCTNRARERTVARNCSTHALLCALGCSVKCTVVRKDGGTPLSLVCFNRTGFL